MPLPFAPPPDESKLYQQLESTTLNTLTADQLATIRAKTFSQGTEGNEDEYRRLLLLGLAADKLSLSGPIPGTGKLIELDETAAGPFPFFIPDEGEVWQCIGAATGTVLNSTAILLLTNTDGDNLELGQESSVNVTFNPTFGADILIDSNVYLSMNFSSNSAPGSKALAAFIRVR